MAFISKSIVENSAPTRIAAGRATLGGFRMTIFDERNRGDNSKPRLERVVVAGE